MTNEWHDDELKDSIKIYIEMVKKYNSGISFIKKHYYEVLAKKYNRTVKSIEYRMQNISYVYYLLGRSYLPSLKPKKNVGTQTIQKLEKFISEIENKSYIPVASFESAVINMLKSKKTVCEPQGIIKPISHISNVSHYSRNANVKAWILKNANGVCELCHQSAPFLTYDEIPFLEIHHVKQLSDGGSDTISNAVALCPNCHREIHYGKKRDEIVKDLYSKVKRLIYE